MKQLITLMREPGLMFTKLFQNQDQDQAQVKKSSTMDFFLKPTIII